MPENVLNRLINDEIEADEVFKWIFTLNNQQQECADFPNKFNCTRAEFIAFLLNFIHEDLSSTKGLNAEDSSGDLDTSSASTPKKTPHNGKQSRSDSLLHNFTSPVSPIYKSHNSFGTQTRPNKSASPICLGDFITPQKQSQARRKRITPTNMLKPSNSSFQKTQNSFNFNKTSVEEVSHDRSSLLEEKEKILKRHDLSSSAKIRSVMPSTVAEIEPKPDLVTHRTKIDALVRIYSGLIDSEYVLNVNSEIYFLVSLLMKKQFASNDLNPGQSPITFTQLFGSVHNITYFIVKSLETQLAVLSNYDKATLKLLSENLRLSQFNPTFAQRLSLVPNAVSFNLSDSNNANVCFNLDTDNRENFPHDASFHAFRKQRDLFYEILRLWEQNHHNNDFNFGFNLGAKIRSLLTLNADPTNLVHFARLFKSQLMLNACQNGVEEPMHSSLDVDARKLNRLTNRCITKEERHAGFNAVPEFSDSEEFYKEFILTAHDYNFNRHLADALIANVLELHETNFDGENDVDLSTKRLFYATVKSLRLLAKFLGFIDALAYKNRVNFYTEHVTELHVQIRDKIHPNFDVAKLLKQSIERNCLILCLPWLTKYLSMLDFVSLRLSYYRSLLELLYSLYQSYKGPFCNKSLVRFVLGWFFELPHIPQMPNASPVPTPTLQSNSLDQMPIVDQNVVYLCCPYLDVLKIVLRSKVESSISVRHITPVTALPSPVELAKTKLEQQLEEAFFNGQPISLRKTVDFVSERVASIFVKYICADLVPACKKAALQQFRQLAPSDQVENGRFVQQSLNDLTCKCHKESEEILSTKVSSALAALLPLDVLEQTKNVAIQITRRNAAERVRQWSETHLTAAIFTKDFHQEIHGSKKEKRPVFALPAEGTKPSAEDALSPAHLLDKIRRFGVFALETSGISETIFVELLDSTLDSIDRRGDMNECVLATISLLFRDLAFILMAHQTHVMNNNRKIVPKLMVIWNSYNVNSEELFKNLLCPRNRHILSQSNNPRSAWKCFARFCCDLLENNVLTCDSIESQCVSVFREDLDDTTLKNITEFFKDFTQFYGDTGKFTWLLDFLSDYCQDL